MSQYPKRVELVKVSGLPSSYFNKKKTARLNTENLGTASFVVPNMALALNDLYKLIKTNKGTFYITELTRNWQMQKEAREKFENGSKKAFVAKPGESFHNAARAIDFDINELKFENIEKGKYLQFLWDLARPLGFRPVIKAPIAATSEAWHLDFPGSEWQSVFDKIGYAETAKCCVLDAGMWDPAENIEKVKKMFIQAQILRLGLFEIGLIDGILGKKSIGCIQKIGYNGDIKNVDNVVDFLKNK